MEKGKARRQDEAGCPRHLGLDCTQQDMTADGLMSSYLPLGQTMAFQIEGCLLLDTDCPGGRPWEDTEKT